MFTVAELSPSFLTLIAIIEAFTVAMVKSTASLFFLKLFSEQPAQFIGPT